MASGVKYHCFVADLGLGVHDLDSDTLKIALTNSAPDAAAHATLSDITELTPGTGYSAGGNAVGSSSYAQSGGTAKLAGDDVTFTASGGTIGPFRYQVLYNDTSATDAVIAYWDRGASLTLQDGESFSTDFTDNLAIVTVA